MNKELRIKNITYKTHTIIHDSLFMIRKSRGQALVTLLFFSIVAITITSAAVIVTLTQAKTTSAVGVSGEAYYVAESGAENALLRLLRDQAYTGEQLSLGTGVATIQVAGENPKTITSQAIVNGYLRTIQVQADYTNNVLTVLSWKEVE